MSQVTEEKVTNGKLPWEARFEQDHAEKIELEKAQPKKAEEKPIEVEKPKEEAPVTEEQPSKPEAQPEETQPAKEDQPAKPEEGKKDASEAITDEEIKAYAVREGVSEKDAKEDLEKNKAILAKYQGDPMKLAKAIRNTDSELSKLKSNGPAPAPNPVVAQIIADPRGYVRKMVMNNQEKLVAEFRAENPARSRDMDDEQVLEEQIERGTFTLNNQIKDYEVQVKTEGLKKRNEYLAGLSEVDRQFMPEIKPVLDKLPDHQIISPNFKMEDLVFWAKGKAVDRLVKEADERGYKRAKSEQTKIVGEVPSKASPAIKSKSQEPVAKGSSLSNYQKGVAKQMYAGTTMTDDEMYEAFFELNNKKKK